MKSSLLIVIASLFTFGSCITQEKNEKFISNFDNEIYLIFKNYIDTSSINFASKKNNSIAIKYIAEINNKNEMAYVNDSIILQTYQSWLGDSEDAFCGASSYHMKRRIRVYIDENKKVHTLKIGILSANIEKSLPPFIHHIDSCLKASYFKVIKSHRQINVHLDIKLQSCRIGSIVITSDEKVDKNLINELYKIIYTSPKWMLEEVDATPVERKESGYNREKNLNINISVNNNKTEILNYTVDSLYKN